MHYNPVTAKLQYLSVFGWITKRSFLSYINFKAMMIQWHLDMAIATQYK